MCRRIMWLLAATLLYPCLAFAQAPVAPSASQLPDFKLPLGATKPAPTGPPHTCPYPPVSIGSNDSGITVIGMKVSPAGTVEDSVIVRSSGSPQLDYASQLCVKAWLYTPATRDGQPIEAWLPAEINWHMNHRGAAKLALPADIVRPPRRKFRANKCEWWHYHKTSGVLLAFYVEQDGTVANPGILKSSGDPAVDKDALDCVILRAYEPATQNGKPVEVRLTERMF